MQTSLARIIAFATITAAAGAGLMQGAQRVSFDLPVAAYWGQTLLGPGHYKISLPESIGGVPQLIVRGAGKAVYELPMLRTTDSISDSSYLKLRNVDGNYFVRELSIGPNGQTFEFHTPKAGRHQQISERIDLNLPVVGR